MRKSKLRTLVVFGVLIIALINVYPTLGWMILSEEERAARIEQWKEEDAEELAPSAWRNIKKGIVRWSQFDVDRVINLGLDLQGGVNMIIGMDVDAVWDDIHEQYPEWKKDDFTRRAQEETLSRIERRVSMFEAKEPVIQALGDDQIQIQLPGQKDVDRAKELITKAAFLEFHLLCGPDKTLSTLKKINEHFDGKFAPQLRRQGLGAVQPFEVSVERIEYVRDMVEQAREEGVIPEDVRLGFSPAPKQYETKKRYQLYFMDAPRAMSGEGLKLAVARQDEERGADRWKIIFVLDAASGDRMGEVTEANIGRPMAIVVDGVVESAPVIESKITNNGSITGNFDQWQARDLAIALSSGSMQVPVKELKTGVVGPGLGRDSISKGVYSAVVGLILVVLFMAIYYRVAGVVADIALLVNALLIVAALAYFNATLTLPGIAGLILTIGMAVDANVLIFERIREEILNGKSLKASIDSGFSRATVTILDANVTTLIAAAVLMEFGTGPIEGFAATLSIGVCSSVFTALIVTRAIMDFMGDHQMLGKLAMTSLLKGKQDFKFLERRRVAAIASVALILVGAVMFGIRGEKNLGVDFRTGTNIIVNLQSSEKVPVDDVRDALAQAGFNEPSVVAYEQATEKTKSQYLIQLSEVDEGEVDNASDSAKPAGEEVAAGETAAAGDDDFTVSGRATKALAGLCNEVVVERVDTVGPAVGRQLQLDALRAIFFALVFIVAYLWFRFELRFAVGAVVALAHDVLVTVGLFAIFQRQISLPVVAALLTIIGYSLNDTIVVFDRVREDMKLYRGKGMSLIHILNLSINQTLSRTILTSLTTLFVVVVLSIFGGEVIRDFALALVAGVLVGTYSSIFVASPVVYLWQKYSGKPVAGDHPGSRRGKRKKKSKNDDEAPAEA